MERVYSFLSSKKKTARRAEAAQSRVASLHEKIQAEFDLMKDDTHSLTHTITQANSASTSASTSGATGNMGSECVSECVSAVLVSKPKINLLQKSEKKKQLEAFERERIAAENNKKRVKFIEKEAKREVDKEIAELERLQAEEEELKRVRKERAEFWTKSAQQQQAEAANYDRFLQSKKEEKLREKQQRGCHYKPAARQSYEDWLLVDESKKHLYAQAIREEQLLQQQQQQQQQQHSTAGNIPIPISHSSSMSGGGGGMTYDSSMFATNDDMDDEDDEDELGGTTSMLTAEELAQGMDFDQAQPYGQQQSHDDMPMTAKDMSNLMQPSRDWMSMQTALDIPHASERLQTMPSDFYNHEEESIDLSLHTFSNITKPSSKPPPPVKKQSAKSAISEYNAKIKSKQQSKSKRHLSDVTTKLYKSKSTTESDIISDDHPVRVVTDTEMDKMKNDLKIFQAEEEMTQLLVKQNDLSESLDKIEDTIEKIDTKLYCRERDLDNALENKESADGIENTEEIISQLNTIISKLKQSQRLAELKKDELEEQMFVVERDMKKISVQLKTLKKGATLNPEQEDDSRIRLPDIRCKHRT